ncbi:hypothetical protein DFJ73DRAFT_859551 [Zopfochytrium polystomum]|nr:hypothetical protein DFJ73DRAFT_859551 [Zopfochytrium polystomum]
MIAAATAAAALPPPPAQNVTISRASPSQARRSWVNNYDAWGAALSLDQYVRREEQVLAQTPFGRTRAVWVVFPNKNDQPEDRATDPDPLDFVCSCETYPRPFLPLCSPPRSTAARAMRLLSYLKLFESWLLQRRLTRFTPEAQVVSSTLYSEFGWKYARSFAATIDMTDEKLVQKWFLPESGPTDSATKPLHFEDVPPLIQADWATIRDELSAATTPTCAVPPTLECVEWFFATSDFYEEVLFHENNNAAAVEGTVRGAIFTEVGNGTTAPPYILWAPDFVEHKLVILRLRAPTAYAARALLTSAIRFANGQQQVWQRVWKKVVLWNPDVKGPFAGLMEDGLFEYEERGPADSLSAIAFVNHEQCEWVVNEKFAWV